MQEPGGRPFAGVDLRRPKGYPASPTATASAVAPPEEKAGDPCPRCESRDTKFCYYNNYNTSQPRHYCRSCRRYWTKGGSLRNVPVGGGSRKSTSSSSSSSSSASPKRAKNSKRRRVAPAAPPEPEPGTTDAAGAAEKEAAANNGTIGEPAAARTEATANGAVDDPAIAMDTATTKAGTTKDNVVTADDPATFPAADGVFIDHPSVALGLGAAYAGGKEEPDLSPFEWPSGCDLGSYWAPGVFAADTDPVLFLDLP